MLLMRTERAKKREGPEETGIEARARDEGHRKTILRVRDVRVEACRVADACSRAQEISCGVGFLEECQSGGLSGVRDTVYVSVCFFGPKKRRGGESSEIRGLSRMVVSIPIGVDDGQR